MQVYVGMDVHKKYTVACAMDGKGKILNRAKITHGSSIAQAPWKGYFKGLPGKPHAVLEATGISYPILDAIEPYCRSVGMAHPLKTKLIAEEKVKTDTIDGDTLAHLKRVNFLPMAYIPPQNIRDQRELLRHRISLVRLQTMIKNKIHSLLTRCGEFYGRSDLFGISGRKYLAALALREPYKQEVERYLRILDHLAKEIKDLTRLIHQRVEVTPDAMRLTTIPGIGKYSAALIYWETGDIERFLSPAKYVSYCRLAPSVHSSGGKTYYGRLNKQGNRYIIWALIQAAQRYRKNKGALGDYFRRIERRKGSKAARVACARKVASIIWHLLKKGEDFDEGKILKDRMHLVLGPDEVAPHSTSR